VPHAGVSCSGVRMRGQGRGAGAEVCCVLAPPAGVCCTGVRLWVWLLGVAARWSVTTGYEPDNRLRARQVWLLSEEQGGGFLGMARLAVCRVVRGQQ